MGKYTKGHWVLEASVFSAGLAGYFSQFLRRTIKLHLQPGVLHV